MEGMKMTFSLPLESEEVVISNDIIFLGVDGVYRLPAGQYTMPIPMWEKMTVVCTKT